MRGLGSLCGAFLLSVWAVSSSPVQQTVPRPAVPIDPITAIIDAFRAHALVALGEAAHSGQQDQAFRLSLVRDPRFAGTVNDIVVERGNARYQDLMDRFVRGEDVAPEVLRHVWQDTTGLTEEFDIGFSEEFFRAVRAANASLPRERQIRVLLGDPPIEWENVRTFADVLEWGDRRDQHAAEIIQREVLAKQHRGLVIYGRAHFQRQNERTNFETADFLAGMLDRAGASLFTIWTTVGAAELATLPNEIASWRVPSLALLKGTDLGSLDYQAYSRSMDTRLARRDGRLTPIPRDQWRPMHMEDQFDALLYLGPTLTSVGLPPALCADADYLQMRTQRMALAPDGQGNVSRLRRYCAAQVPR
jgi:hypothetical protein